MKFNEKFKRIIKESGKQQKDIAQAMGVAPSTISKLINGDTEPNAYILKQISIVFDVSVDWLLGISESRQVRDIRKSECRTLGLSDYAIDVLRKNAWQNRKGFNSKLLRGLNILFEQDKESIAKQDNQSVLWNLCKLIDLMYDDFEFSIASNNEIVISRKGECKSIISDSSINNVILKEYYISKYIDYICVGLKQLCEQKSNIDKDRLPKMRF